MGLVTALTQPPALLIRHMGQAHKECGGYRYVCQLLQCSSLPYTETVRKSVKSAANSLTQYIDTKHKNNYHNTALLLIL